jgi:hypothetical protein
MITLHPILFGKSTFTYRCACQAEVAVSAESKLQSRNCRSYWNLKVSARGPRLESNYVSTCKLQPLYFVIGSFLRGLHYDWWKLCIAHFCEVPKKSKTILTAKMAFKNCWRLQHWTLHWVIRPGICGTWVFSEAKCYSFTFIVLI